MGRQIWIMRVWGGLVLPCPANIMKSAFRLIQITCAKWDFVFLILVHYGTMEMVFCNEENHDTSCTSEE